MCLFKKWRQKRRDKKLAKMKNTQPDIAKDENLEEAIKEEAKKNDNIQKEETVEKLKIRPFAKPKVSNHEANEWPKEEVKVKEEKEEIVKKEEPKEEPKEEQKKYQGKYEIYPESGFYKFRLKASNGEILAVSFRYTSDKGAQTGIKTFKKNVEEGSFDVVTDKNNFTQFHLYNASGARLIISGELYKTVQKANSAVESVKRFYDTEKIDVLDDLPKSEIREEAIEFDKVDMVSTGKYELYKEDGLFFIRLRASNSQILMISQGYASKASAKSGLKTIQNAITDKNFTISRDKQNRYQYNLYSSNGQIIVTGETYPSKSSCISSAHSVLKFGLKAELIEV